MKREHTYILSEYFGKLGRWTISSAAGKFQVHLNGRFMWNEDKIEFARVSVDRYDESAQ